MKETTLRNSYYRVFGYVREEDNGNVTVYDWRHRLVGTYNKSINTSYDWRHIIIGKGNCIQTLLDRDNDGVIKDYNYNK